VKDGIRGEAADGAFVFFFLQVARRAHGLARFVARR